MEVYTVPFGNAEALVKKKLENCIILSSHILLDHYTPHFCPKCCICQIGFLQNDHLFISDDFISH